MADMTDYGIHGMPLLKDVLAEAAGAPGKIRAHIQSGAPRYWFGRRQVRRVHGTVRYKNGRETFRSKSITDEVLGLSVARTVSDKGHGSVRIYVFSPYGHKKDRPEKGHWAEEAAPHDPGQFMIIPDGIDEELPFN